MFRIIKKWYFKIYHLFKLIGIFILIFGLKNKVMAEECNVIYKNKGQNLYLDQTTKMDYYASEDGKSILKITPDTSKKYTMFVADSEKNIYNMQNLTMLFRIWYMKKMYYPTTSETSGFKRESITYQPTNNGEISLIQFNARTEELINSFYENVKEKYIYVVEGENVCFESETPTPEPSDNEVYTNFLTMYTNKLSYLATGFTTNKYLLAMVGIIFGWIVLELFLRILHLRGGK